MNNYPIDRLHRVLFMDIETATQYPDYELMSDRWKDLWTKKAQVLTSQKELTSEEVDQLYHDKAAIYSEFARVVCISVGYVVRDQERFHMKIKSFAGDDEVEVLSNFHKLLNQHYFDRFQHFLCGHNIKEFDVPFICRRTVIHGLPIPNLLRVAGSKPWQVHHFLDTIDVWKFGDYKHYTSLDLLTASLNISTPKDDISGKDVSRVFWAGEIDRIARYCERDVAAVAKIYLRCMGLSTLEDEHIEIV